MSIYEPFTYLIGWPKQDKWYYGVRYAKNCNTADLWKTYFTSSNYVIAARYAYGEPEVIKIDKIFDDAASAVAYETMFLVENAVLTNNKWLNKSIAGAILIDDIVRYKLKQTALRRVETGTHHYLGSENNSKRVQAGTHNFLGGKMQQQTQLKNVCEGTHHLLGGNIAKKLLQENRHPSQKEHICPKCGKVGKGNAMYYYHFDNCGKVVSSLKGKSSSAQGSIWINDGIFMRRISSNQNIPDGWKKGRLAKNKK